MKIIMQGICCLADVAFPPWMIPIGIIYLYPLLIPVIALTIFLIVKPVKKKK